jgi:hypothetical protein
MPIPNHTEPPKVSLNRVIGTPPIRSSKHSIAGTAASVAASVEMKNKNRSRAENVAGGTRHR